MKKVDYREYLNNVLKTWTRFCKTHRILKECIEELLKENENLKK